MIILQDCNTEVDTQVKCTVQGPTSYEISKKYSKILRPETDRQSQYLYPYGHLRTKVI